MAEARRVALVTGASSGIGKEAARALVASGWQVIAQGRDAARCAAAEAELAACARDGGTIAMLRADLASLADTARLADEVVARTGRLDVLLANAGGVRDSRLVTTEGNEATFAGNHLGHFLLVKRLLPLLRAALADAPPGAVRVIATSSRAHLQCQAIDWDDLQGLDNWNSIASYGVAKLANILFVRELARRHGGEGLVAHALHPGVVASNFASHGTQDLQRHMATAETIAPGDAAEPLVWLATADEPGRSNGGYWQGHAVIEPSALAQDDAVAARLWLESEALLARAGF